MIPAAAPHPLSDARAARRAAYRATVKRVVDVALVLLAAPVVLPVVGLLAGLTMLDGGPAFYAQRRIGRNGAPFLMWKLRSMVVGADAALEAHLAADPAARREWDRHQKLERDPRVTWMGRITRRTSLDELPQLWNVLAGDMSLVGPRPMMEGQRALYPGHEYYRLRPGLTGAWQVSARHESDFADRAGYDRDYDRALSVGGDARIIAKTVGVVLRASGR
ncbi:sugar transferase [Jannaschia sp. Os4]|uniref:sugar transferase n=1 Tax=Jannaschia sp. Os4 TaxID=2807617 RepID=UPI00193AA973|nr:sugar transferase [Jannaschia sp. Os4]MBM2575140.1 sugar transferase [Jannaschia sp. Os4]